MNVRKTAMTALNDPARAVIQALLEAPLAWQTPAELAHTLGWDVEELTDLIATLDAEGWLESWEGDDGHSPAVTLSVRTAYHYQARLIEQGPEQQPRWATNPQAETPHPRALGVFRGERSASLEMVIDPRDQPDVALEAAEEADDLLASPDHVRSGRDARLARMPRPTLLLGSGMTPWPGPGQQPRLGQCCPVCHGEPLRSTMYCLSCDRWGLDHQIVEDELPAPRTPIPGLVEVVSMHARREAEVRTRKAKRRARLAAMETAQKGRKVHRSRGRLG